jgi:PIN domain nuclease of toxin-antitoxin system
MIILDTHIWVNWILGGYAAITPTIVNAMQKERYLAVSAISCFEVSLLASRGKLELPLAVNEWLAEALSNSGVESLPVTCEIANRAVALEKSIGIQPIALSLRPL